MNDFKEIILGDAWCRYIKYDDSTIGLMLPYMGETLSIVGTEDSLIELAERLFEFTSKLQEESE